MLFRKKRDDEEIARIKQALQEEKEEEFEPSPRAPVYQAQQPMPRAMPLPQQEVDEPFELEEIEPAHERKRVHHATTGAPLFVKVEKYSDIIESIQEMKSFVSGVKQLFAVLYELETVRNDALKIMRNAVQRLDKSVSEIDAELLRPQGLDLGKHETGTAEVGEIEDSLSDLQRQLAVLRKELTEMK